MTVAATYRLQLHPGLSLAHARELVDYLARLGVSHLYSSPLLRSRRGSTHGYDVVDPTALDPELGTEADLEALVVALRRHAMGLVLDIVPNHMAASDENPFWEDVLAHGPSSLFASWFDVDWGPAGTAPIVIPVLGDHRARVLARRELGLAYTAGRLRVRYFEHTFPLDPATWPRVLGPAWSDDPPELRAARDAFSALPEREARDPRRVEHAADAATRLDRLYATSDPVRARIDGAVAALGEDPERLAALLDEQAYRLVYWRRAAGEINYRRFFNVSDLVGVRVEEQEVFAATHARILEWVGRRRVDGLRIDHIDGLWDPRAYLARLQALAGVPLWVEKILTGTERLPEDWPIAGTTGYEFLNTLETLFVDPDGFAALEAWYRRLVRAPAAAGFEAAARAGKRRILDTWLAPDVRRLARQLRELVHDDPRSRGLDLGTLTVTLVEVMVCLPVYRTYVDAHATSPSATDRAVVETALATAAHRGGLAAAALELLAEILLLRPGPGNLVACRAFVQRFQQTSGPVMAKGVEDTALYRWVPLLSRNEVGGDPGAPLADAAGALHEANAERAVSSPASLLCTSTHDTKRSADVRARLDVLSELPARWTARVTRWRRLNRPHHRIVRGRLAPDVNTEYLLYQSLVGIWPLRPAEDAPGALHDRLRAYMRKAVREAKVHTSWLDPEPEFEQAVDGFVDALFAPESAAFLAEVAAFAGDIARAGLWTALARTLVHLTAPGVPDVYQGDELWSFSLTDPDNRQPVDFALRRALLAELEARAGDPLLARDLVEHPEDGRIKLEVVRRTLALRRAEPTLFAGEYEALSAEGDAALRLFAFLRRGGGRTALCVVSRLVVGLGDPPIGPRVWANTFIALPAHLREARFSNVLTGEAVIPTAGRLAAAAVLATFPVALLVA